MSSRAPEEPRTEAVSSPGGRPLYAVLVSRPVATIMAFVAAIVFRGAFAFMTFAKFHRGTLEAGLLRRGADQSPQREPNSKRHPANNK